MGGGRSYATPSGNPKASAGSFDTLAARNQQMAESRAAFQKARPGPQPRESYTDRGGVQHPIDPKDRQIEILRRELDYQRWQNRQQRQQQFFGSYYHYPVVVYHDPYSSFFWWWLLDRSLDERAHWAYYHRPWIDDARYHDLLARDANLEARIRQMEAQNLPRDPTYRPNQIDPDLMYSDPYVDAIYNPQPATRSSAAVPSAPPASVPSWRVSSAATARAMAWVFVVMLLLALTIWLVFYKRWGSIGD